MLFFLTLVSQGEQDNYLDRSSSYIINSYTARSGKEGKLSLKFYENKELKGEPVIVLNNEGLKVKGKLVCMWNARYPEDPMLKEIQDNQRSSQPCPRQGPIVSGFDSSTIIEVKDNLSDEYYETTKYEGKSLYISKKETDAFGYRESEDAVQKAEIAKNKSAYEELKKTDKSLVEFLNKWNKCVEAKDQKCLPKKQVADLEEFDAGDLWRDYACVKNEEVARGELCTKWIQYRCRLRSEIDQHIYCDSIKLSKTRPKIPKEFDKKAKDFVWSALFRCFAKENIEKNYVMVKEGDSDVGLTIQTRGNEPQVSCKIWKNWKKNSAWVLEAIIDQSDFRLDGEFQVY